MKAGELILTTHDEYADYAIGALVRVLKDGDMQALASQFLALATRPASMHQAFLAWLVEQGWVEYVGYSECHLGSYGSLEPEEI